MAHLAESYCILDPRLCFVLEIGRLPTRPYVTLGKIHFYIFSGYIEPGELCFETESIEQHCEIGSFIKVGPYHRAKRSSYVCGQAWSDLQI